MEREASLYLLAIRQKDNHTFTIEWNDGTVIDYRLSDLQKRCPCAACRDELTGECRVDPSTIDEKVRAKKVESVGRYALRIFFTKGCIQGIYSYPSLRFFYETHPSL